MLPPPPLNQPPGAILSTECQPARGIQTLEVHVRFVVFRETSKMICIDGELGLPYSRHYRFYDKENADLVEDFRHQLVSKNCNNLTMTQAFWIAAVDEEDDAYLQYRLLTFQPDFP